jgi:flagellar hook-associated protein 1 FlgK
VSSDVLGVSVSGLLASQRALSTTSHNIANASTPGYSRQRVVMEPRQPQIYGNGAVGTGVKVSNINRIYDEFLVSEVRDSTTKNKYLDTAHNFTTQVDNMLADPEAGLSPAISGFFDAVNGLANDPSSTASRQVLLSAGKNLSDRFGFLNDRFESLRQATNKDIDSTVGDINETAKAIADINKAIVRASEIATKPANDLLDQRDLLVQKLAEKINVRVTVQEDGRMNVFVGNGQTLVVGDVANKIEAVPNEHDPTKKEIVFVGTGGRSVITQFLTGGELGGIAKFRKDVLDPAQNELGRIAIGIATTFNKQHHLGMDLNNRLGGDFFTEVDKTSATAMPSLHNRGDQELGVTITDSNKLTTSDYELTYFKGQYELLRLEDGKVVSRFKDLPQKIEADGFEIHLTKGSKIMDNDRFLIQPTRRAADKFGVAISSVEAIAAATPIRAEADIDNLGDAKIAVTQITNTDNPAFKTAPGQLSPPYVVRFVDDQHFQILDNSGKPVKFKLAAVADDPAINLNGKQGATPAVPASETGGRAIPAQPPQHGKHDNATEADKLGVIQGPIAYDKNKGVEVFPVAGGIDRGFHIKIKGQPKAGDMFRIEFNTDGTSDNSNALALAQLQSKPVLMNGTSDYAQTYGQLVSRVGSKTHELDVNQKAQKLLLDRAIAEREETSGVNLDEEAADMLKYQKLYQANARVIAAMNQSFQVLMDAFRR